MFLTFSDGVENGQNVNFSKLWNVIFTYVGYIEFFICGYCMVHSADKQFSSLYAVHFMFLAFPDGVENVQNVNFSKFRNVIFTHVGFIGFTICGNCMLRSADKQSNLLCAVELMVLAFLGGLENAKKTKKSEISKFIENNLVDFGGGYFRGHFIIPIWRRIPQSVVQCLALLLTHV